MEYQDIFTAMVARHRQEVENLKVRWLEHHQRAEGVAHLKIDDLLHTSKVLASLESFDAARDVRDRTMTDTERIIADEVEAGDTHFRTQFEALIERHRHQYAGLLRGMNEKIALARGRGAIDLTRHGTQAKFEEAMSSVELLRQISGSSLSAHEKRSVISNLSPSKMSGRQSTASNRSLGEVVSPGLGSIEE
jgi:hypothetical protein